MSIAVLGAGAFGTALAISLARAERSVTLWGRDAGTISDMRECLENKARLPGIALPEALKFTADIAYAAQAQTILLAVPAQQLRQFLKANAKLFESKTLVVCSKGIDLETGTGPSALIAEICPTARIAILTGPSFAIDIAQGLPTALTLAVGGSAKALQTELSTHNIRLYSTADRVGAELGGAIKNVIAIACGAAMGAGLGESARAALMTRGFAEMTRFAVSQGADAATLAGLSGFGDLVLTCTSAKSRNYAAGLALGAGKLPPEGKTVEGIPTAHALVAAAEKAGCDMPISNAVSALVAGRCSVSDALEDLLSRPLKEE
ncbi:NAD(P)H-dependent glycerol-3-phosphate dehydrogenase [Cognatishimia sp. MH4019]|uniref:NAD(P)H-dependent glycerol-3-phosphate dehydrogenase n=1 Tax=Cognatishimia sp. MH4019 TaxID=2854030 RepID=UPI001CD755C1|nr:NAD(P)H-dependent glycerol-3-phosphate dehydrogenase [Cognatishimia sp. MH4019]